LALFREAHGTETNWEDWNMPEGTEKDLSIDEEQSEEVAGGLNLSQSALKVPKERVLGTAETEAAPPPGI